MWVKAKEAYKIPGFNIPVGGFADLPPAQAQEGIEAGALEESSMEEWMEAADKLEQAKLEKKAPRRSATKEKLTTD